MACLHCYKPIEPEKLEVLPEARYCIGCAKALNDDKGKRITSVIHYCPPIRNSVLPRRSFTSSDHTTSSAVSVKSIKKAKNPVLMEAVFDSGKTSREVISKKVKSKPGEELTYDNDVVAVLGDVVFTESEAVVKEDRAQIWVVDNIKPSKGTVRCHCESDHSRVITLFCKQVKLLYRKDGLWEG